jgi:hypothetical protein
MTKAERLYRMLLRLYPASFRSEYAADLEQALRDRSAEHRHAGAVGRLRLAWFVAGDLLRSLPSAHMQSRRALLAADGRGGGPSGFGNGRRTRAMRCEASCGGPAFSLRRS